MQIWVNGLFGRACTTWLVLVLFLLSCTAQPPAVKAPDPTPALLKKATRKASYILAPKDFHYRQGKWLDPKELKWPQGHPSSYPFVPEGFKIQDYPQSCSAEDCGLVALSASMGWPSVGGINSSSISADQATSLDYGFQVLSTGKNESGFTIATEIRMALNIQAVNTTGGNPPFTDRSVISSIMQFSSTDGKTYQPVSNGGNSFLSFSIYNVNNITGVSPTVCQFWQSSGLISFSPTSSLTLTPGNKTATLKVSASGPTTTSGQNWLNVAGPEQEEPQYACMNIGATGSANFRIEGTVRVPFVEESPDLIDVQAFPGSFSPADSEQVKITVDPVNDSRPWTLKAKAKSLKGDCTFAETTLSSGQGTKTDIPFGGEVPDGEYELIAEYDDANAPKEPGQTTVTASSEVAFNPGGYLVTFGLPVPFTFTIKQPVCPKGKITLISGTLKSIAAGSQEVTCQPEDFGTAGSQFTWDGICQGPNGDVSGIGQVEFKLEAAGKSDTATVRIEPEGTGPTGPPTPPKQTNRPRKNPSEEPTAPPTSRSGCEDIPALCLECPVGSICSGKPKPPTPGPRPPVPPEVACPPAGICPPPTCSGSTCPDPNPTPCPQGAICLPPPSPTPKPDGSCSDGYIYVPKIDANGNSIGGECDYCPKEYFDYDEDNGCYLKMFFKVEHAPNPPLGAPFNPVTFSPRDINGVADKVHFITAGDINSFPGLHYVRWDMAIASKKDPNWKSPDVFKGQEGLQTIVYDGWQSSKDCLIDGEYSLSLILQPKPYLEENPPQIYVQVPKYKYAVPTTVFIKEKDKIPFRVDNTPPVVKNLVITERVVDAQAEIYETDVSFTLVDPKVNESGSTLPDATQLEAGALQIFADDAPFYTSPAVDADGFWIASLLPQNLKNWKLTKSSPTGRQAQVSFTLRHRLAGHTLEVEVQDTLANTGRYILYPEGN